MDYFVALARDKFSSSRRAEGGDSGEEIRGRTVEGGEGDNEGGESRSRAGEMQEEVSG